MTDIEAVTNSIIDSITRTFQPDPDDESDPRTMKEFLQDVELFRKDIAGSLKKGWTRTDIVLFISVTEEMNPFISEDRALKMMSKINARNVTNFGGHLKRH